MLLSTNIRSSPSFFARLALTARDIKLSHTIFALPFALLAMFLAAGSTGRPPTALTFALIVLCMVLARTTAMTFNRFADRRMDADNPRTIGRAIPSGRLSGAFMFGVCLSCAIAFIAAAGAFAWLKPQGQTNYWPLIASPFVLVWLCLYSVTKRFTWLCHVFLGAALALSPLAAALAVEPGYLAQAEPYLLAAMVLCWVAGFDIIYALQDVESDRRTGVRSMPANLGETRALWISRALHLCCLTALIALTTVSALLHIGFILAVLCAAALLILEHILVWRSKTHHLHMAFFTVNGVISVLLATLGVLDILLHWPN